MTCGRLVLAIGLLVVLKKQLIECHHIDSND